MAAEQFEEFLSKIDKYQSLIKDLASSDEATILRAVEETDRIIAQNEAAKKKTVNKTVINQQAFSDITGAATSLPGDQQAFIKAMEADAQERYERRKLQESEALEIKDKGNVEFRKGNYQAALELYSKALQVYKCNTILWTNRAQTHIKLGQYEEAISDCDWALRVSEKCLKAHVHKGKALAALGKYNEAVISYRSACEVDPSKESVIRGYIDELKEESNQGSTHCTECDGLVLLVRCDKCGTEANRNVLEMMSELTIAYLPVYVAGVLYVIVMKMKESDEQKAVFVAAGGLELTYTHPVIAQCMEACPTQLSENCVKVCHAVIACLAAVADKDRMNQKKLLEIPYLPQQLLKFLSVPYNNFHSNTKLSVLILLDNIALLPTSCSEMLEKFDILRLVEVLLSIMCEPSKMAAARAVRILFLFSQNTRFQTLISKTFEVKLLPLFEDLMVKEEIDTMILRLCIVTLTNLCANSAIHSKLETRQQIWDASCKALKIHNTWKGHEQVVQTLLSLLRKIYCSEKAVTAQDKRVAELVCDLIQERRDQDCTVSYLKDFLKNIEDLKDIVITKGIIPHLVENLGKEDRPILRKESVCCIFHCTKTSQGCQAVLHAKGLFPLVVLLKEQDEVVCGNAAQSVCQLLNEPSSKALAAKLVKTNIIKHLLTAIRDNKAEVMKEYFCALIAKLSTLDPRHRDRLQELHGFETIDYLLKQWLK